MKTYSVQQLRNVGLFSHGSAGKTSLTEAMLFLSQAINRLGRVEDGNTASDWDPDEIKRQISISLSVAPIEWKDHKINILDAPGYADFFGEVKGAMSAVDFALILLDASAGVEVGTEHVWRAADENQRARGLVINKLDRENASFDSTMSAIREVFGNIAIPLQVPIGVEKDFRGVVDVLERRAFFFSDGKDGVTTEGEIPADLTDTVESYRIEIIEQACEADEDLMMRYLEDEEITVDEIQGCLKQSIHAGTFVPIFITAATSCKGVAQLLDALVAYAPSPIEVSAVDKTGNEVELSPDPAGPLAALVFKTVADPFVGKLSYFRVFSGTIKSDSHVFDVQKGQDERVGQLYVPRGKEQLPVSEIIAGDIGAVAKLQSVTTGDTLTDEQKPYTLSCIDFPLPAFAAAVYPKTKSDLDKLGTAIQRLIEEDPTLHFARDGQTGESLVSGLGESHVQIGLERMARKFGVSVETGLPLVAYRETISMPVQRVEYKHKKQTGGHGQYGHVFIDIEPIDEGDFQFDEKIVGGVVPKGFIPAVEKGIREALDEGVLAGFPVTNIRVTLVDGSYHTVDSSEMAFKIAAAQAFKKAVAAAKPVLLEPVMMLRVSVPEAYMGDVMSDLNGKRAHVQGMVPGDNGVTTIEAIVPAAEIQRYATDLRSITAGRGSFTAEFDHYQVVPNHLTDAIIAENKSRVEAHA